MGVGDFLDVNDGYFFPIPSSVFFPWLGIIPSRKDQAVGVAEVGGELVFAVSFKFVDAGLGQVSEVFKAARRLELRDSCLEAFGGIGSELFCRSFPLDASFSSFLLLYSTCIAADFFRFLLTYPVKEIFQILLPKADSLTRSVPGSASGSPCPSKDGSNAEVHRLLHFESAH
jgi:hypothetical protein